MGEGVPGLGEPHWLSLFIIRQLRNNFSVIAGSHRVQSLGHCCSLSVPGPLLFIIYVKDLPDTIKCSIKLFADDAKLYSRIMSSETADILQSDLTSLTRWSTMWLMPFNRSKWPHRAHKYRALVHDRRCQTSNYNHGERPQGAHQHSAEIQRTGSFISLKSNSSRQVLAMIRLSIGCIDKVTLPLLFKALVCPHLQYANLIWGPSTGQTKRKWRVQHRATCLVECIRHGPYEGLEQILEAHITLLQMTERLRGAMIHAYQMFHNGVDADPSSFFKP